MGVVYILQSQVNQRYYIGSTCDLERRLIEHDTGKSQYTKLTKPFKLVFSQGYGTLQEARKIEYKLKQLKSRAIIERIVKDQKIEMNP